MKSVLSGSLGVLFGLAASWACFDNARRGYLALPTGRHSSISFHFRDGSPWLVVGVLFWGLFIVLFLGAGLMFLRDAVRREPLFGD